jgi:S1-C subfamily serine protease
MYEISGFIVGRKFVAVTVLVLLILIVGLGIVLLDMKSDIASLRNDISNLSSEVMLLQEPAVRIWNQTRISIVSITTDKTGYGASGFIYDFQGYIVTNNHVIQGAINITVKFFDGSTEPAQIIGTPDVYSDLALIKVDKLPDRSMPLSVRNSTQLMVGEPVYAIGNPFGLTDSVTSGIISQLGRMKNFSDLGEPVPSPEGNYSIPNLIQFDAAVNMGNSGGPLLDSAGNVVGITFALETDNTGINGFIGIGYAVPSILILREIPAIKSGGHYNHPWIGIKYDSQYNEGVKISNVVLGGPADKAGLLVGDTITQVDSLRVNNGAALAGYLESYKSPGDQLSLEVNRSGTIINKTLTVQPRETAHPSP